MLAGAVLGGRPPEAEPAQPVVGAIVYLVGVVVRLALGSGSSDADAESDVEAGADGVIDAAGSAQAGEVVLPDETSAKQTQ